MNKFIYSFLLLLCLWSTAEIRAQVVVSETAGSTSHSGALLDLQSTNKGLILPNIALTSASGDFVLDGDKTTAKGMLVYNTASTLGGPGVFSWDGSKWVMISCAPTVGALTATTVCVGGSLSMTANVISNNGSAVTGYAWKLGGTTIGTAAGLSYTVSAGDNGKTLTLSVTNSCGTTTTSGVTITVNAAVAQGTPTAAAATICTGTSTTISLAAATGGVGTLSYNWQSSTDNSTWANAAGTRTGQNYTTANLTATTYFRRVATGATCGTHTSASVKVTVNAAVTQGTPTAAAATICTGTSTTISLAAATGGVGTLSYNWQSSTDNSTWANAAGTRTGQNYTTANLTATTYFRRVATGATCGTHTSASVKVTVNAAVTQGTPTAAAATICTGTSTTISLAAATGGVGTLSYNWQSSTDNSTWANAAGTRTGQNYTTANLTATTYFRRVATGATCGTHTSASVKVTVNAAVTQGTPTAAATIINNGSSTTISLAAATGGVGTITYNWQSSTDNSTWANAAGTRNGQNYTTANLTATTYFRRVATGATCGTHTSASVIINVVSNTLIQNGVVYYYSGITSADACLPQNKRPSAKMTFSTDYFGNSLIAEFWCSENPRLASRFEIRDGVGTFIYAETPQGGVYCFLKP
ncbi:hypothetical protein FACS189437_07510 [Bacteroidia bacterium]|nr:hypothetical protein FACS189437_07510 [Bacteroidia bacterium]